MNDKETRILDLVLPYIPYYGEFDLSEKVNFIKKDKLNEVQENLSSPTEQIITIQDFLTEHGFATKRNDRQPIDQFIELNKRGRWLKQLGNIKSYNEYQKKKKEKVLNDEAERITAIERNKQMNRLTKWIAISTGVAALYYMLEVLNHFFGFYCH